MYVYGGGAGREGGRDGEEDVKEDMSSGTDEVDGDGDGGGESLSVSDVTDEGLGAPPPIATATALSPAGAFSCQFTGRSSFIATVHAFLTSCSHSPRLTKSLGFVRSGTRSGRICEAGCARTEGWRYSHVPLRGTVRQFRCVREMVAKAGPNERVEGGGQETIHRRCETKLADARPARPRCTNMSSLISGLERG